MLHESCIADSQCCHTRKYGSSAQQRNHDANSGRYTKVMSSYVLQPPQATRRIKAGLASSRQRPLSKYACSLDFPGHKRNTRCSSPSSRALVWPGIKGLQTGTRTPAHHQPSRPPAPADRLPQPATPGLSPVPSIPQATAPLAKPVPLPARLPWAPVNNLACDLSVCSARPHPRPHRAPPAAPLHPAPRDAAAPALRLMPPSPAPAPRTAPPHAMQPQQPSGGRSNSYTLRPQQSALQPRQHSQYLGAALGHGREHEHRR